MTEPKQNTRAGDILGGKYRVIRFIAEGGMAAVYEAQHLVVKRRFAVKVLRTDFSQRREILERFQREAETAGRLESKNIAAAVDFGIASDGSPFIVMEYLVGESLDAMLARERSPGHFKGHQSCLEEGPQHNSTHLPARVWVLWSPAASDSAPPPLTLSAKTSTTTGSTR